MTHLFTFILGVVLYWFVTVFTERETTIQLADVWKQAYQIGKDDGYMLGKHEFSYTQTHEWLESKCMFLYDDVKKRDKK